MNLGFLRDTVLTINNPEYLKWVKRFTIDVFEQDLGKGDITTIALFGEQTKPATAFIQSKDAGVVAGIEETMWFYTQLGVDIKAYKRDGEWVKPGDKIVELNGSENRLLETERTGLKVLQRMSGIATMTRKCVQRIQQVGCETLVVATRKTHWQLLDKRAVILGGGGTHRLGLWESILIKDNHLEELKKAGYETTYIKEALERAWQFQEETVFIEIEVEKKIEALEAAKTFHVLQDPTRAVPFIIMLDNMPPQQIIEVIAELQNQGLYDLALLEASSRINPQNILDVISLGS